MACLGRGVLVAALLALTACTTAGESGSPSTTPSASDSSSVDEGTAGDPVAVPLGPTVPPEELPGDDGEFLEQATTNLDDADIDLGLSDDELVERGRTFCSILTGGGMVAAKVDVWSGSLQFDDGSAEVFDAALDAYCPDLRDGYLTIRTGEGTARPTSEERADLARFFLDWREVPTDGLTDGDLSTDAAAVCLAPSGERWLRSKDVRRTLRHVDGPDRVSYLFALTLAYCDDRLDDLKQAFASEA
ncbi:DUF732 domain-containing protein [Nocardioides baculatus]|uniref:DUF732 domain-containing protein n=1 Tax=Nocardioides baculatus TaxID=2801337 RepID=A0ABS1LBT4_9ACTN|nr:DUF732 domain-containing protein [Nocardioides baculatus]MBL0748997.1 hypothetical protein [Nocardioides baculatus]